MSATTEHQSVIKELGRGSKRLVTLPIAERQELLRDCVRGLRQNWEHWASEAWLAKRIPDGSSARAEDILTGPLATVRYLRLLDQTLNDLANGSRPSLPGATYASNGRLRVPVFPTNSLYDRLLFGPLKAHVVMSQGITVDDIFGDGIQAAAGRAGGQPTITLVLGAGNVSSIPITDALTKIFQQNQAVLLKMNPVNEYLGPVFEKAFASLIQADLLRIVYGNADVGQTLIADDHIDCVHITGSDRTHDAIVWGATQQQQMNRKAAGNPLLQKQITSELGNVSPWIIVPGHYTRRQLRFQAENIVASVTANASFMCVATKMLVTCQNWPQRDLLLDMIDGILASVPRRYAYYPGATDRYTQLTGKTPDADGCLQWTFRRGVDPLAEPHLFDRESFVCVFGETAIESNSPVEFLNRAVDFVNEGMWGTLSAAVTVPQDLPSAITQDLDTSIDRLKYGTVGINQWPGVAFALMSTPWGAYPGSTLLDIQSGIGSVHNTYLLGQSEKTVLSSPLTVFPKPMWFSTHRRPESVARNLLSLYLDPSFWRIPRVIASAVRG